MYKQFIFLFLFFTLVSAIDSVTKDNITVSLIHNTYYCYDDCIQIYEICNNKNISFNLVKIDDTDKNVSNKKHEYYLYKKINITKSEKEAEKIECKEKLDNITCYKETIKNTYNEEVYTELPITELNENCNKIIWHGRNLKPGHYDNIPCVNGICFTEFTDFYVSYPYWIDNTNTTIYIKNNATTDTKTIYIYSNFSGGSLSNFSNVLGSDNFNISLLPDNYTVRSPLDSYIIHGFPIHDNGTDAIIMRWAIANLTNYKLVPQFEISNMTINYLGNPVVGTNTLGLYINPYGTKVYYGQLGYTTVYQHTLNIPWDSRSMTELETNITDVGGTANGIFTNQNGTFLFVVLRDTNPALVKKYVLATAWNLSTATLNQTCLIQTNLTTPKGLYITPDGRQLFLLISNGRITRTILTNPWDLSDCSNTTYKNLEFGETYNGLWTNPIGTKFYIGECCAQFYLYQLNIRNDTGNITCGNIETGTFNIGNETATTRRACNITSSVNVTDYQFSIPYALFNNSNLYITDNTAPRILNMSLTTFYNNSLRKTILNCSFKVNDYENDKININVTLHNNINNITYILTNISDNTSISIIPHEITLKSGETWNCSVTVNDNILSSTETTTQNITNDALVLILISVVMAGIARYYYVKR